MLGVTRQSTRIDLAAFDAEERPVLLVEVKALTGANPLALDWMKAIAADFWSTGLPIPYWMMVDLDRILIFSSQEGRELALQYESATGDILSVYDPTFRQKRIFDDYLLTLINAWLHDLARQWKTDRPPGMDELVKIGLVEKLRGGETHREVSFARRDFVYRNQFLDESFFGA